MFQRIETRDAKTVTCERSRCGSAPRSHRNPLFLRKADEIGNDEEVSRKSHLIDHGKLVTQPLLDLLGHLWVFPLRPRHAEFPEVRGFRLSFGHGEAGDLILSEFKIDRTAIRNHARIGERLGHMCECFLHFLERPHGKVGINHRKAIRVVHVLVLLNAKEHIVRLGILYAAIVAVRCGDERNTELLSHAHKLLIHFRLPRHGGQIHKFEVHILFAKEQPVFFHEHRNTLRVLRKRRLRNLPSQRTRECNEPFPVFFQKLIIHARLVVHTFERRERREFEQVLVSLVCFRKERERIAFGIRFIFIVAAARRDVDLASKDRLYPFLLRCFVEIDEPVHIPFIRKPDRMLPKFYCTLDNFFRRRQRLEEAIG